LAHRQPVPAQPPSVVLAELRVAVPVGILLHVFQVQQFQRHPDPAPLQIEYVEQNPDGYSYTQFCEYYRRWLSRHRLSMRQVYRAGEKGFVDYSGKRPWL